MVRSVIRRRLRQQTRFYSQTSSYGICSIHSGIFSCSSPILGYFPVIIIPKFFHTHLSLTLYNVRIRQCPYKQYCLNTITVIIIIIILFGSTASGGPCFTQKLFPFFPASTLYPPVHFSYFSLSLFTLSSHLVLNLLIPLFLSDLTKNILFRMRSSFFHVTCHAHRNLLIRTYFPR